MSELEPVRVPVEDLDTLREVVVPITGEVVSLDSPAAVADVLDQVRDMKRRLDDLRALLEDVLRLEAERMGTKTLHLEGFTAVVSGGKREEFDHLALADELRELGLPEERIGALVVETITYRVDQRVAKQLAAANPRYGEAIERHSRTVPAPWRVSVKRGGT